MAPSEPIELLVCATCRLPAGENGDPAAGADAPRPGAVLHRRLLASPLPDGVRVSLVKCLSNCSRGCTVALRGGSERWTYVYGDLDPETHLETLLDGVRRYRDAPDGVVPWRERPLHFRKHCIARVPPSEFEHV